MTRQTLFPEDASVPAINSRQTTPTTSRSPTPLNLPRSPQVLLPNPSRSSTPRPGHTASSEDRRGKTKDTSIDDLDAFEMNHFSAAAMDETQNRPLLAEDKHARGHGSMDMSNRPPFSRTASGKLRTRSPVYQNPEDQTRKKYLFAGICLVIALVSFVVQTETAVYIQHELHWNKAYCMLWLTHGSWSLLWPIQLLFLRIQKRKQPWAGFWRRHKAMIKSTAQMVVNGNLYLSASKTGRTPWPYMIKTTAYVTTFLTFAGASWYVAVDLTSPSDLTAIYNCSAFFAYVFSIMLLKEKARLDKIFSVALAIAGVLVVAYGDSDDTSHPKTPGHSGGSTNPAPESPPNNRLAGNIMIGIGSVLYGLYEVIYKKYACPPDGTSPTRGMVFANTFGSFVGLFTLTVLWIPLPILHFTGLEKFELPRGKAAMLLTISTISNAVFSGSFLVLMSLTSPVLSSVAALLTIFLVAITDWLLTGKPLSPAAILGGSLIIIAFVLLSWATYREIQEEARQREANADKIEAFDDDEDDEEAVLDERALDRSHRRSESSQQGRRSSVLIRGDQDGDWDEDSEEEPTWTERRRHRES